MNNTLDSETVGRTVSQTATAATGPPTERQNRLMPLARFEAECARIGNISDPRLFLQFLRNAGEVFWREGCFDNQIILDQAWVLEAVYTIFNRENCVTILTQAAGRFGAALLDAVVWGPAGYSPADQKLFLEFMVSSGICFAIRAASGMLYIAPDFLPADDVDQPTVTIDRSATRCLQFDSLPPLLMRNLISRVGNEAGAHGRYWRNGVHFFDSKLGSRVLIEQSCSHQWRGEIRISTEGGDAQKAMEAAITAVVAEAQRLGVSPKG
ncbi:COR domain-containing protein, partial [Gemmobacter denitrificans]